MRNLFLFVVALFVGGVCAQTSNDFPSRPIRILVGASAGGGGDSVARLIAEHMSRTLGQPAIIENRPGAGATLGAAATAAAAPDGYTLALVADARFGADKVLWRPNVKYDETSFTPIARWASTFFVIAAGKGSGIRTIQDLLAKARNTELFVAAQQGIYTDLLIHRFHEAAGTHLKLVPFKGGAQAVLAAVTGETPLTFSFPTTVLPLARDGRLVALAVTGEKRSSIAPEIGTLQEAGLTGFNATYWYGLAGPAGLPDEVVQKLFRASNAALADADVRATLALLGYEAAPSASPAEFRATAIREGTVLREQVEALGLKGS